MRKIQQQEEQEGLNNKNFPLLDPRCPPPPWAAQQIRRASGLIEDVCEHGIGHPNREWLRVYGDRSHLSVHGCDGCCTQKHKEDA